MTRRLAEWLFTVCAIGEIGVGLLVATLPADIIGLLLGAALDRTGTVVARMMGIAILGLGLAWWPDRHRLDAQRRRQVAPGFVTYNVGVGCLFLFYAWTTERPVPLSWLVAAVHLLAGGTFAVLATRARD
jgi:hypothetical protein